MAILVPLNQSSLPLQHIYFFCCLQGHGHQDPKVIRSLFIVSDSVQSLLCLLVEINPSENQDPRSDSPGRWEGKHTLCTQSHWEWWSDGPISHPPLVLYPYDQLLGQKLCISLWLNCMYYILEHRAPILQSIIPELVPQLTFNRMFQHSISPVASAWVKAHLELSPKVTAEIRGRLMDF